MSTERIKLTEAQVGFVMLYTVGILMSSLMLGTKIAEPTANLMLHPFLLLLILVWCVIGVTYIGCNQWTRNWILQMSQEAEAEASCSAVRPGTRLEDES